MQKKEIAKAIGYSTAAMFLVASFDLLCAYYEKNSRDYTLTDLHNETKDLKVRLNRHEDERNFSQAQRKFYEKRLSDIQVKHQQLDRPISTVFFGIKSYRCPICKGKSK